MLYHQSLVTSTFFLFFPTLLVDARASTSPEPDKSLVGISANVLQWHRSCEFKAGDHGYNLCPLMHKVNLIEGRGLIGSEQMDEGSSPGRRFYEIALGGSKNESRTPSQYLGTSCPEGTWVCMLEMGYVEMESDDGTKNKFYRTPRKATLISGRPRSSRTYWNSSTRISFTVDKDSLDSKEKPLSLKMKLYQDTRDKHVAEITFLCSDIEHLSYTGDDDGVHSFLWATPQGCPAEADTWSIFAIIQGLSSMQRIVLTGIAFVSSLILILVLNTAEEVIKKRKHPTSLLHKQGGLIDVSELPTTRPSIRPEHKR